MSVFETEYETEYETPFGEIGTQQEAPLSQSQEMELAAQLLEISNEEELEQFLGNLVRGAARAVGGFVRSPVGQALGGVLKNVAKQALPVVGGALGSMVAPGVGTAIGSKLGSLAGGLFELELESMDREEAEFEVARRIVRLSAAAGQTAAKAPPSAPPQQVVRRAITVAARRHAPGLVRNGGTTVLNISGDDGGNGWDGYEPGIGGARPRTGRWVRRGRKVVLYGI
jgi:hypothetical protein